MMKTMKFGLLSLTSLCFSNCLFSLIEHLVESNLALSTYFKAISFRQSHYFICYFSQMLLSIATLKPELTLTRQLAIELPWSLSQVVTNWNVTMHLWLKKCNIYNNNSELYKF